MFALNKKAAAYVSACLTALLLPPAAWGAEQCTATLDGGTTIDFGNIDVLEHSAKQIPVNVTVRCETDNPATRHFHVCLAIDGGRVGSVQPPINERYMCNLNSCGNNEKLRYNFYIDNNYSTLLGTPSHRNPTTARATLNTRINIPGGTGRRVGTESMVFYARIEAETAVPSQKTVQPGQYQSTFLNAATALMFEPAGNDCGALGTGDTRMPFTLQATVTKQCYVEADDLNFGSVPATTKNLRGETQMRLQCTLGTPYTIGLTSDNAQQEGYSSMQPKSGGSTGVPYSLHRSSPPDHDNRWGFAPGLRAHGQGTGTIQTYPVFGKVESADYRPGEYQDTVRIEVTY
ncbi:Csu type fimbrial protein [Neisseria shayeganii]|uniref:Spore coat protein U domain-containing protein n=1 Tax=Neisseria shayeganii TaxID=607712 RepID=A0A7D7RMA0_9NEIS|nr:spore coat U domain-containing protein [Neisseria shayeganii]QMT40042.1 spore coat protein U domain-containing protein [Neisseria shayeganii]